MVPLCRARRSARSLRCPRAIVRRATGRSTRCPPATATRARTSRASISGCGANTGTSLRKRDPRGGGATTGGTTMEDAIFGCSSRPWTPRPGRGPWCCGSPTTATTAALTAVLKGVPAFREGQRGLHRPVARGHRPPGAGPRIFVTLAEIAPTFIEVAGAPHPQGLTGRSLVPFLRGAGPGVGPTPSTARSTAWTCTTGSAWCRSDDGSTSTTGSTRRALQPAGDPHELANWPRREHHDSKRNLVRRMWRFAGERTTNLQSLCHRRLRPLGPRRRPVAL